MRAVVQRSYGGPEKLELVERPTPTARAGQVLVRVAATSINMADLFAMTGEPHIARLGFGLRRPKVEIQGRDVAGTVVALGPGVSRLAVGDEVIAEASSGSFAEYVAIDEKFVAKKPSSIGMEAAATLALAGGTALQGIQALGRKIPLPGARVLVTGASGGVGHFAVQIANHLGAKVTGECSFRSLDFVTVLGAEATIDYATTELRRAQPFDGIFDLAGERPVAQLERALVPKGHLTLSSGAGGPDWGPLPRMLRAGVGGVVKRHSVGAFTARRAAATLEELGGLVDAGAVTPMIDSVFPLKRVRDAVEYFRDGHPRGKVVLAVV